MINKQNFAHFLFLISYFKYPIENALIASEILHSMSRKTLFNQTDASKLEEESK
jgi:hypothetical protein